MPSLIAVLGLNSGPFKAGLMGAANDARLIGTRIGSSLGGAIEGQIAKFASFAALEEAMRKTLEYSEQVRILSIRTGQSTDQIQKWDYAANKAGVPLENLIRGFEKFAILQAKAKGGDAEALGALHRLGLNRSQINDLSLMAQNFEAVGTHIKRAEINGQMFKDITLALGKTGREIIPVFKLDIKELGDEIERLGGIMTPRAIAEGAAASERMKLAWFQIRPLVAEVTAFMARRVMEIVEFFQLTVGLMIVDLNARRTATKRGDTFGERLKENWAGQKDRAANVDEIAAKARKDYLDKIANEHMAREREIARMEAALKEVKPAGLKPYESPELKEAKAITDLKERLYRKQEENDLKALSREGQLVELAKRRAMILGLMRGGELGEEGMLKAALDIENIDAEMRGLSKVSHARGHQDLNSLQKIGGMFVSPIENVTVDLTRKIEANTRKMVEHFTGKHTGWHTTHH